MNKVLFRPVKPFWVNQHFGENKICISLDGRKQIIGCDGYNPPEGYKSLYGVPGHLGVDLSAGHGQEVYAAQDGIVYMIDTHEKSGLDVRIESNIGTLKFRHIYEHLMGYQPKVGDKVRVGQLIGWADNTGYSSGDHLHFQMEILQGKDWIKVDPMHYMEARFALDQLALENKVSYLKQLVAKLLDNAAYKLRK